MAGRTLAWMVVASFVGIGVGARPQTSGGSAVADRMTRLTRSSLWRPVASIPVDFRTFHPPGMAKVGETFFVSAVEVTTPTRRLSAPVGGLDRTAGVGIGHLFKMDGRGRLLGSVTLGDDALRMIARELVDSVRKNVTIDWTERESIRAKLRVIVKRILRKHGYPPDKQELATTTVLQQAALLSEFWSEAAQ
jgi:hypothetical protein